MKLAKALIVAGSILLIATGCGSDKNEQNNTAAAGYGIDRFNGTWGVDCRRNTNTRMNAYERYKVVINGSRVKHYRDVYSDPGCNQRVYQDVRHEYVNWGDYRDGYYHANMRYDNHYVTPYDARYARDMRSACPTGNYLVSQPYNMTGNYCPDFYGAFGAPVIYTTPAYHDYGYYRGGQNYYTIMKIKDDRLYFGRGHGDYNGRYKQYRHNRFWDEGFRRY